MSARAVALLLLVACAARADFIDLWADKTDSPRNKAPPKGHSRVVLLPVQIDYGTYPPLNLDQLKSFFTGPADGSFDFDSFYRAASNDRFRAEVTVAPLVEYQGCPPALASQPGCGIARGDISALKAGMDFVRDVFRRSHDENHVDFRQFDANGPQREPDGTADGVLLVVNVPGVGIAFPIAFINAGDNLNGGTGGPLVLDGIQVPYVAIAGPVRFGGAWHFETVMLHEFGHTLGLADLYYENPPQNDPYPRWGGLHLSLMGDYAYDDSATLPDPESRKDLAWQDVHVVSGSERLTLPPAASGGQVVKLGIMSTTRKEYFLVENRGPAGAFDKGVTDAAGNPLWGLSVTHVDWKKGPLPQAGAFVIRLLSCLDCDPFHPFLRNVESADGMGLVFRGTRRAYADGVTDDQVLFGPGQSLRSIPGAGPLSTTNRYVGTNWYDGSESGIAISDISVASDHSVTATFTAPAVSDPCADVACVAGEMCSAGNCVAIPDPVGNGNGKPAQTGSTGGCAQSPASWVALLGLLAGRRRYFLKSASSAASALARGSSSRGAIAPRRSTNRSQKFAASLSRGGSA